MRYSEPIVPSLNESSTYVYDRPEDLADLFELKGNGHIYSRISNPTVAEWERKIAELEGGKAAVAFNSGHAAIFSTFVTLFDGVHNHIVASSRLYGGTHNMLEHFLPRFGIHTTFVDITNLDEVKNAISDRTYCIFTETLSNPDCAMAPLVNIKEIANYFSIPLIVDNTMTPPIMLSIDHIADIVTTSTTKYYNGHSTGLSGAAIDMGNFDWSQAHRSECLLKPDPSYHGVIYAQTAQPFITKLRAQSVRDMGNLISPKTAYDLLLLSKTLNVRFREQTETAEAIIDVFKERGYDVLRGPSEIPVGAVFSVDFGSQEQAFRFIEAAGEYNFGLNCTHICCVDTIVTHSATTTHSQLSDEDKLKASITPGLVRISIGLEGRDVLLDRLNKILEVI